MALALVDGVAISLLADRILAPKTFSRGGTWLPGCVGSLSSSVAVPDSSSSSPLCSVSLGGMELF